MIRNIISMAKANPRWAVTALSLDAAIGTVVAVTVFIILNLSVPSVPGAVAIAACGLLAILGIVTLGYSLLIRRQTMERDWGEDWS